MISALIGSVIMSAVTLSMLLAIDITDEALYKVGKYPLTNQERQILKNAGLTKIPELAEDGEWEGFDIRQNKIVDFKEEGIIASNRDLYLPTFENN